MTEETKFTIFLPTFNSQKYIRECIGSIITQFWRDFELHVVDGGSTDGTVEYIKSLDDRRIIIHTSDKTLSIEENWHRFISIPKKQFMTIIGHDDVFAMDYLSEMHTLTERYPSASLYQTHFTYIDANGNHIRDCKPMTEVITPDEFLRLALSNGIDTIATGFMMHSKDYDAVGGIPLFPKLLFADDALWISLTRKGDLVTTTRKCFSFRQHDNTSNVLLGPATLKALEVYTAFLLKLKQHPAAARIIEELGPPYIYSRCREISHRIIRKKLSDREGLTVSALLRQCKKYAEALSPGNTVDPGKDRRISAARIIDSNFITRNLFFIFKKIYSKPVLKN